MEYAKLGLARPLDPFKRTLIENELSISFDGVNDSIAALVDDIDSVKYEVQRLGRRIDGILFEEPTVKTHCGGDSRG